MPRPPPPPYRPGLLLPLPPPTHGFPSGAWVPPGEEGQQVRPPLSMVLASLGLSDFALHTFSADLQAVVAAGVSAAVPSPAPSTPAGNVETLSLLHLCFAYRVEVDGDLPPI